MLISLAEIVDTFDTNRGGRFMAKIKSLGDAEKTIKWTSPYNTASLGTIKTPVPPKGTSILVTQPDGCGDWFYLGCTDEQYVAKSNEPTDLVTANLPVEGGPGTNRGGETTKGPGTDDTYLIQNELGNGLELVQSRSTKAIVSHTKLFTAKGKKVLISDSPGKDYILLDSNSGSKITITDNPKMQQGLPAHSVQIETTQGDQRFFNMTGQTDLLVKDGRELQLLNNSTGSNKGLGNTSEHFGNVNLQSGWRDINIFTQAKSGRIFIECLKEDGVNQVIELQTHGPNGTIRILATGKVDISAESVGIEAANSIDIRCDGNLNLEAGGAVNIKSGSGNVNIQGPQIQLNSNTAAPANPNIGDDESYYGTTGVTTY